MSLVETTVWIQERFYYWWNIVYTLASECHFHRLVEILKKELDKCILVCSNCHRELEAELSQPGRMVSQADL